MNPSHFSPWIRAWADWCMAHDLFPEFTPGWHAHQPLPYVAFRASYSESALVAVSLVIYWNPRVGEPCAVSGSRSERAEWAEVCARAGLNSGLVR